MNILHVDDSPEICQLYADMLAIGNNTVKSVNDGREGLELYWSQICVYEPET